MMMFPNVIYPSDHIGLKPTANSASMSSGSGGTATIYAKAANFEHLKKSKSKSLSKKQTSSSSNESASALSHFLPFIHSQVSGGTTTSRQPSVFGATTSSGLQPTFSQSLNFAAYNNSNNSGYSLKHLLSSYMELNPAACAAACAAAAALSSTNSYMWNSSMSNNGAPQTSTFLSPPLPSLLEVNNAKGSCVAHIKGQLLATTNLDKHVTLGTFLNARFVSLDMFPLLVGNFQQAAGDLSEKIFRYLPVSSECFLDLFEAYKEKTLTHTVHTHLLALAIQFRLKKY